MYFSNGYVYGGEPSPLRKIKSVRVLEKKHLLLCFDNDEKRVFDANILICPCFSDLDNPNCCNFFEIYYKKNWSIK